ncbi:uncharacterized protein LOC134751283 [Cydia strobilella]|uniref:uncharacterized protein LOC134751283 n=1 Tax=Cydia strobilella TaxID=1100964 RepID=UPI003007A6D8
MVKKIREEIPQGSRQLGLGSTDSCRARSRRFSIGPEQERSLPKLRSSRAGFATRSTLQPVFSSNSPSSTSTTSLAQLREKLTLFTPVNFTKVPARIAATPELPILIEKEYEKLSSGEPKRYCGINTRDLQPITQESDIVENTPFAETAHRAKLGLKRKPKEIEGIGYTTDDSDVVDDTPCYDYDWRKRCRNKSDKTNKKNYDGNETINEKAVDTHFCQQQQNIIQLISPATIKRISESLSRDEDSEDDCYIIDDIEIVTEKENELNLDIDTHVDLLVEQQQQIDISRAVQNIDKTNNTSKILKMNNNTLKSPKDIANEVDTPEKSTYRHATKQVIQKKRKLYSPKDDDNENNEIPRFRKERRPSSSTESPIAACYKELENARKSRIRLPRRRASTQPVISPKTRKLNDIFDNIKDNVVDNEKITLVNKKSDKDLSLYNVSSESDDELFQKKNFKGQKCISLSSLEPITKRRRSVKPVDYTSYYSSEDECQRVVKKAGKQTKPRSRKAKKIQSTDLIDERMRNDQPEVLETSFVQEKGNKNVPEEPQPSVNVPVLETMPDIYDEPIVSKGKPQTPNKQEIIKIKTEKSSKKRCVKLTKPTITKRSKEIIKNVPTERESATVSPLPGLVVETVPPKDENTSLDANLLQKLKKIYTDVDSLNTTRGTQLSVAAYKLQAGDISDVNSENSIETGSRFSIIGHNDLDESPPNLDALNESFQSSEETEKIVIPTQSSTNESKPVIVLKRITSDEINKWLPMPETKDVIEKEPEIVPRKTLARRKSVLKPCISCESIPPVKLNFDTVDLTNKTSIRDTRTNMTLRSRTRSSSNIEKLRTEGVESLAEEVNDQGISSQESVGKSAQTKNLSNDRTVGSTVDPSEMGSSVASVQSWLEKNAEAGSSKKGETSIKIEMLYKVVMKVLNTLVEINEKNNEAMQAAFVNDLEELKCLNESHKKQITAYMKNKMDRDCSIIRADAEKKARMVLLLKEDIERILKH